MKRLAILLIFGIIFHTSYAQDNPYAVFGYKPKVEYKTGKKDIYRVTNTDTSAKARFIVFDKENKLMKLLDKKDSLLQQIIITDDQLLRWTSVDPLSEKYPSLSPYNYTLNNPIKFVDPDGRSPEWIPKVINDKITLVAEKGNNAKTLATFLNVDQGKANQLYGQMGKGGTIALPDNIPGVSAINATISDVKANPDNYSDGFFAKITTAPNYNCFNCALSVANGNAPDVTKGIGTDTFDATVGGANYKDVTGKPGSYKFGETVVSFADKQFNLFEMGSSNVTQHAATYLGTSQNGTQYTWSKNGFFATPQVQTVPQLKNEYGNVVKYYNTNRSQ